MIYLRETEFEVIGNSTEIAHFLQLKIKQGM